jgi:hypothetical protein
MSEKIVTIASFSYDPQQREKAELARKKLISQGIEGFLDENHLADIFDWPQAAVKLQVKASEAARALEILQGDEISIEKADPAITEKPLCPKCNSAKVDCEKFSRTLFYISLFFKFPVPFLKQRYKCTNCRHSWY